MLEEAVRDRGGVAAAEPEADDTPATKKPAGDGAGVVEGTKLRPPGLLELENLLAEQLDTRVSVQLTAKRGRVTIEFADLEDLERIYRVITG